MSTAVERYTAPAVPDISDRQWNQLERKAKVFAKSNLAPERWRGDDKVDDISPSGSRSTRWASTSRSRR
jgi:hypothetical protein